MINGLNPSIPLPLAADAGLPNLGGAKVSLVVRDATPVRRRRRSVRQVTAGNAVTQLVSDDGVQALVGAYDPEVTEAASQRSERYEVPFVNADSPATFLTDAGRDWFFRIGPSWRTAGEAFFSLLRQQNVSPGKIVVLHADDKAGQDVVTTMSELRPRAATFGAGSSSASPRPAADVSDLRRQRHRAWVSATCRIDKVRRLKPDTLLLYSTPATVQPLLQAFASRQYKPKVAMSFSLGYVSAQTFAPASAAVDGLMRSTSWSSEAAQRNPAAQAVTALYQRRFNSPMTEAAASSFTAVMTVAQAVNSAGTLDNQRVRSALLSLDIPGEQTIMPWAGIQFDETHQNTLAQALIEQYHNNTFTIVYPNDAAARGAKAVIPAPNASG